MLLRGKMHMSSYDKIYTITEYDGFTRGIASNEYVELPEKTFDDLESLILTNNRETEVKAMEFLSLSARRGVGKIITARNYVGLISMSDGTVIEILPKIVGENIGGQETKQIFMEMLKTLKDVAFKDFNISSLHVERLNLFEIFIRMFLEEVATLTKKGLKAAYTSIEENERFYKGKLLVSRDIKHNIINKERFYVQYDDFNVNTPENRLIKATLELLYKRTIDSRNKQTAGRLMNYFESVGDSTCYDADFSKCIASRSTTHYEKALSWCRIFIKGNSFTAFAGKEVALALLFPMEKIFESFIGSKLRSHVGDGMKLHLQESKFSLFDNPNRAFALRPDFVLEANDRVVVLDTKWKLLSDNARNKGISQSDMYQMYAYGKKYNAEKVILLYPHSDNIGEREIRFASDDGVRVDVSMIDLMNVDENIADLLARVC